MSEAGKVKIAAPIVKRVVANGYGDMRFVTGCARLF